MRVPALVAAVVLVASVARADQPPLRVGTLVPDGTSWSRELKAFARDVEQETGMRVKIYWGGIAGDEREMVSRVRRGQLDALAGAAICTDLSPSLSVTRLQGLFPDRDAHERMLRALPGVDDEFKKAGFVNIGLVSMGPSIVFLRRPVSSWEELKKRKLWRWEIDPVALAHDRLMGLQVFSSSITAASSTFETEKLDGFVALAASALAFQWQSVAPNVLPLEMDYLSACMIVSQSAWDALPLETQHAVRAAGAKLQQRMELVGRDIDRVVLSGTLTGHGVRAQPLSPATREAFFRAAHATLGRAAEEGKVPPAALRFVEQRLAAPAP